jgi:hypothetical protein
MDVFSVFFKSFASSNMLNITKSAKLLKTIVNLSENNRQKLERLKTFPKEEKALL